MLLSEILKKYKPHQILDILTMEEINYRVAVVLHKDRKKVLIANNVKIIKNLNPELEVLICNSATEFDNLCNIPEGLKVIHCPLVKELPYYYRLPETLEYIVLNSLMDDEDGFFYEEHFNHFRYTRVKKLYMDSITKIDLTRFPNVEYLSLNSVTRIDDIGVDIFPSVKFLSTLSLDSYNIIENRLPHVIIGSMTFLTPQISINRCMHKNDKESILVDLLSDTDDPNATLVEINNEVVSRIYKKR